MTSKHRHSFPGTALIALLAATNLTGAAALFAPAPGSPLTVGNRPTGIAAGDFNGDGKQDMAVANANDNTVSILLGNGAGGFTAAAGSPKAVGAFPIAVIAKDLNADNKIDLAIVNANSSNVTILLGNGAGAFAPAAGSPVTVGSNPTFAAAADFNADTFPDLAITNTLANTATILLGNGAGGFTQAAGSPYATGDSPRGIVVIDLNKDGKADLAIANQIDNHVTTLIGNGAGGFTPGTSNEGANHATIITGQANIYGMTAGDFLNRGTTDVITASLGASRVNLLKGDGAGDLFYDNEFTAINLPLNVLSGDFNGDGKLDVAVICQGTNALVLLLGNGAGGFNTSTPPVFDIGRSPYGIATADFNGDGKLDLVVTGQNDNNVTILLTAAPASPPAGATTPGQAVQIIYFTLTDHLGSDQPVPLQATSSAGLPVSYTVTSGPATISGDTLTLNGLGSVTVLASQAGTTLFSPAATSQTFNVALGFPSIRALVNGASFNAGVVPTGYYATIFGNNLVAGSFKGDTASSRTLGGTAVTIVDSAKKSFSSTLAFVSFGQVNLVVPHGLASGPAIVTLTNSTGKSASTTITVGPVAPGLFSANGTGSGAAAAYVLTTSQDGAQTLLPTFECIPFGCSLPAVAMPAGGESYLILYGTGIRGRGSLAGVSLTIGGIPAPLSFAGAQGDYAGLDQLVALIPASKLAPGIADIKLTVDGIAANTLKINLK